MPAEIKVPMLGESVLEATVGHWLKHEGEPVAVGDVVVELETDKVNAEIAADEAGTLQSIRHPEGDTVRPGDVLAVIGTGDGFETKPSSPQTQIETRKAKLETAPAVRASHVAERLADELGVDLASVTGTGPAGRITKEDVEEHYRRSLAAGLAQPAQPPIGGVPPTAEWAEAARPAPVVPPPSQVAAPLPSPPTDRSETRQRLSRRRLTIAHRLVEAQHTAAMLTTFNECDMSGVVSLRQRHRESFRQRYGVDLGFMSFFTKASVAALKEFPQVNAELRGEELVLKQYYDVGIAIGDPEGLVVPVLRNADKLTFAQIEATIGSFVQKIQDRALTVEDLRGGTFTITNGGVFGSLMSTPILNPPQVGILGMHKIEERPIAANGAVVIHPMMYLALSYDHRVVDGREAVMFLVRIKELIEQPERLMLEL